MWTKHFLEAQGYDVKDTIVYQDNMSMLKLAENGLASAGKQSRHLNIKYFFVTDLIRTKQVSVQYCPSDEEILADYMSKPLTGRKFHRDRALLMNLPTDHSYLGHRSVLDRRTDKRFSRRCSTSTSFYFAEGPYYDSRKDG
jgi:hypothetical protein